MPFISFGELKKLVDGWDNKEGVTIWTSNGSIFKLKTPWWVNMSNACKYGGQHNFLPEILKRNGTLKGVPFDKILLTVLKRNDDTISHSISNIKDKSESKEFLKLIEMLHVAIKKLESDLRLWVLDSFKTVNNVDIIKNRLKLESNTNDKLSKYNQENDQIILWPEWIVDDILQNNTINDNRFIAFLCDIVKTSNGPDILANMFDIYWNNLDNFNDQEVKVYIRDTVLDICDFHSCTRDIKEHVLETYLPKTFSVI